MKKIRLEMARNTDFPNGSPKHGYDIIAPLDDTDHLDHKAWRKLRDKCRVVRFWGSDEHVVGHLLHTQGGTWVFRYDLSGDDIADEWGYRLNTERFIPGEYISIIEEDGDEMIYQVVSVQDVKNENIKPHA